MPYSELARVAIAGSGFLADAYDLYIIGEVLTVLLRDFPLDKKDQASMKSLLSTAALIGAIVGQLVFGALADRIGRKRIFVITGVTIVLGALLTSIAQPGLFHEAYHHDKQIYYQIAFGRLILGFGIGGEYPLSATIASESCTARRRATLMALVFSMQGVGYLLSAILMIALVGLKASDSFTWRFALGFGGFVPLISLYFRLRMEESSSYTQVSAARAAGSQSVTQSATAWKYRWHIVGTAMNWAIFDIVFYANGLFNSDVTSALRTSGDEYGKMMNTLIIVLLQLPGYFVAVLCINKLGRKNIQLLGFLMMFVLFLLIGLTYDSLVKVPALFIFLYGLTFFFSDFGPNMTTYVIPGEIYPSQIKATSHGLSAAAGKTGATLGGSCFELLKPKTPAGLKNAMLACSACSLVGLLVTALLTPRYEASDLERKREGETVGFVPLRFDRRREEARALACSDGLNAQA